MSLNHFFTINMPYDIARSKDHTDKWVAFNREYQPLGKNIDDKRVDLHNEASQGLYFEAYKGINERFLVSIAYQVQRDVNRYIDKVWFYNDETNPVLHNDPKLWDDYFDRIKKLAKKAIKKF